MTVIPGDVRITIPGSVIEGLDVLGFLSIDAQDVTIRNCKSHGRTE